MPEITSLAKYDAMRTALEHCARIDEVAEIRDKASALQFYAKQHKDAEAERWMAEIKLRAMQRIGELVGELEKAPRGGAGGTAKSTPLSIMKTHAIEAAGLNVKTAERYEQLAKVAPATVLDRYFAATKERKETPTTEGLMYAARNGTAVHFSSAQMDWYTPPEIVRAVVTVLGNIDLDPCSNSGKPTIPAKKHYTQVENGLEQPWRGKVYMNPPYGDVISQWVEKLCSEYQKAKVVAAIALVPARTDTAWFAQFADYPVCFVRGRLRFSNHDNSAPFPSALAYLGKDNPAFIKVFREVGNIRPRCVR